MLCEYCSVSGAMHVPWMSVLHSLNDRLHCEKKCTVYSVDYCVYCYKEKMPYCTQYALLAM